MKQVIILLLACFFVSCEFEPTQEIKSKGGKTYEVVVIDSCEYIRSISYGIGYYCYAHKGNCKFCQQRKCK